MTLICDVYTGALARSNSLRKLIQICLQAVSQHACPAELSWVSIYIYTYVRWGEAINGTCVLDSTLRDRLNECHNTDHKHRLPISLLQTCNTTWFTQSAVVLIRQAMLIISFPTLRALTRTTHSEFFIYLCAIFWNWCPINFTSCTITIKILSTIWHLAEINIIEDNTPYVRFHESFTQELLSANQTGDKSY
jgi:hypothetical protein